MYWCPFCYPNFFTQNAIKNHWLLLTGLETVLLHEEIEDDRLRGVSTESCESEGFLVIVDEEYEKEYEKDNAFLMKLIDKEMADLGSAILSFLSFLANKYFLSSDMPVLKHALAEERVTGIPTTVATEFTESLQSLQKVYRVHRKCLQQFVVEGESK